MLVISKYYFENPWKEGIGLRSKNKRAVLFLAFCILTAGTTGLFYWAMENPALSEWTQSLLSYIPSLTDAETPEEEQAIASVGSETESEKEPLWIVSSSSPESSEETQPKDPYPWNLFLVGPKNPLQEGSEGVFLSWQGIEVDSRILQPLKNLLNGAAMDGVYLFPYLGYEAPKSNSDTSETESSEEDSSSEISSEEPFAIDSPVSEKLLPWEESEHSTGLAVDFSQSPDTFFQSEEYVWLQEHAAEYGFILRYPWGKEDITGVSFAPQHFRYVGKEAAMEMKEKGLCLEEYREEYSKEED